MNDETIGQLAGEEAEHHLSLSATGWVNPAGKFEVDGITAGEGRGWMFSSEVLKESVPLWDGVECFVDHAGWFGGRSVRDLGGIFQNPKWCDESQGVRLELETVGPSGPLVEELGRQMLAGEEGRGAGELGSGGAGELGSGSGERCLGAGEPGSGGENRRSLKWDFLQMYCLLQRVARFKRSCA